MSQSKSILKDKSFAFALEVVKAYKTLVEEKIEFVLSKQFLCPGTSVGANIREAKNAESTNDFIHKHGIAQKECDETIYWLELFHETGYLNNEAFENLADQANQILKMIRSTILTIKQKKSQIS